MVGSMGGGDISDEVVYVMCNLFMASINDHHLLIKW